MVIGEFKQHHGHEPNGAWWGCVACNPADNDEVNLIGLRKLVHLPTEVELAAVIYQCRWVDGIKDSALVSDHAIAAAIVKALVGRDG